MCWQGFQIGCCRLQLPARLPPSSVANKGAPSSLKFFFVPTQQPIHDPYNFLQYLKECNIVDKLSCHLLPCLFFYLYPIDALASYVLAGKLHTHLPCLVFFVVMQVVYCDVVAESLLRVVGVEGARSYCCRPCYRHAQIGQRIVQHERARHVLVRTQFSTNSTRNDFYESWNVSSVLSLLLGDSSPQC